MIILLFFALDLAEKSKISKSVKETPKDSTADANLKELKEELERIVKRHEASTTKVDEAKTQLTELSNPEVAEASSSSRHEPSREELLWKSIFGKDGGDPIPESATSQYFPVSGSKVIIVWQFQLTSLFDNFLASPRLPRRREPPKKNKSQ